MRALPGRESRTSLEEPAALTRENVAQEQRRRIMRATGELAAKRGYNNVSMELIVKRAKVSFKTFYNLFDSKEEAFIELFDSVAAETRDEIDAAIRSEPDAPWAQQVVVALAGLFGRILQDPIIARACIVEAPAVGPSIAGRYQETMRALSPLLRRGRDLKPDGPELPETLEDTLAGSVLWSAYQRLIIGEVDRIESLLPETVIFLLRPYVGEDEAARWGEWSRERGSELLSRPR
jgi:AcrR family transcriptional regulator